MPGRRIITDLGISWDDDLNYRMIEPKKNPWQGVEDLMRSAAAYMCGCAAVLAGIQLFVSFATWG